MPEELDSQNLPKIFTISFFSLLFIWIVYWVGWKFDLDLYQYGVYPRTLKGLRGILLSPFIHFGLKHLYNNSIPLFVLLSIVQYFYPKQFIKFLIWSFTLTGLGTWLIGRESYHAGASGIIYSMCSFIFFKGIISKNSRLISISLLVTFLYGGLIWYIFPDVDDSISWEGHLSGFISGIILAIILKTPKFVNSEKYKYDWQRPDFDPKEDPFIKCFDENGNFIIIDKLEEIEKTQKKDNPDLNK